jgi:hypothetical protein
MSTVTNVETVQNVVKVISDKLNIHRIRSYIINEGNNDKVALCLIEYHAMKTYGELSHRSIILDLGTRWK